MEHPDHQDEGYSGYMMTQAVYALHSTTKWQDPADVGNYFILPATAITNTNQKITRQEMKIKEEPPGHLHQYAHRPLKTIREIHQYYIPFMRDDKHRHGKASIWQRQTTCHP